MCCLNHFNTLPLAFNLGQLRSILPSWDDHPFLIEESHHRGEGLIEEAMQSVPRKVGHPTPVRKTILEMKGEQIGPRLEPGPPSTPGLSGHIDKMRHFLNGIAHQQCRQQGVLDDPRIPAPGRKAFRQTRAGTLATRAEKSGDRDKRRDVRFPLPIGLSEVNAIGMELSGQPTERAAERTITERRKL